MAFCFLLNAISSLIFYLVMAYAIISWLFAFNIINMYHPFVSSLYNGLEKILEPLLSPIRRILPNMGGLDLSPVLLLIAVQFLTMLLAPIACS